MSTPYKLETEDLSLGESWKPAFIFTDADGDVLDPTATGVHFTCRVESGAVTTIKSTAVGGEYTFDSATGVTTFLFAPSETATWSFGLADVEAVYYATSPTPDDTIIMFRGKLNLTEPRTGTI